MDVSITHRRGLVATIKTYVKVTSDMRAAARAIWFALKPGGRFAGEMGGDGNLARLREALDDVLVLHGYGPPTYAANW